MLTPDYLSPERGKCLAAGEERKEDKRVTSSCVVSLESLQSGLMPSLLGCGPEHRGTEQGDICCRGGLGLGAADPLLLLGWITPTASTAFRRDE